MKRKRIAFIAILLICIFFISYLTTPINAKYLYIFYTESDFDLKIAPSQYKYTFNPNGYDWDALSGSEDTTKEIIYSYGESYNSAVELYPNPEYSTPGQKFFAGWMENDASDIFPVKGTFSGEEDAVLFPTWTVYARDGGDESVTKNTPDVAIEKISNENGSVMAVTLIETPKTECICSRDNITSMPCKCHDVGVNFVFQNENFNLSDYPFVVIAYHFPSNSKYATTGNITNKVGLMMLAGTGNASGAALEVSSSEKILTTHFSFSETVGVGNTFTLRWDFFDHGWSEESGVGSKAGYTFDSFVGDNLYIYGIAFAKSDDSATYVQESMAEYYNEMFPLSEREELYNQIDESDYAWTIPLYQSEESHSHEPAEHFHVKVDGFSGNNSNDSPFRLQPNKSTGYYVHPIAETDYSIPERVEIFLLYHGNRTINVHVNRNIGTTGDYGWVFLDGNVNYGDYVAYVKNTNSIHLKKSVLSPDLIEIRIVCTPILEDDMDGDGIGDSTDPDRDGDGVPNGSDYDPDDPDIQTAEQAEKLAAMVKAMAEAKALEEAKKLEPEKEEVSQTPEAPMTKPGIIIPDGELTDDENEGAEPEVTEPEVTEPEVTEPEVTEPEVTEPEVTEPEVTEPEVTEPEVTEPEVTEPEVTEPEVTEPEVTEPEVTEPEATEPEVTEPEVTEPEVTEPEVTEPEVTEPEVTEPEVTEPEVTEPEVTEPEVMPSITNPWMSGPSAE